MGQAAEAAAKLNQLLSQAIGEGVLNDQFIQLMQLQDESNPDFVSEVVKLYFDDSASKIEKLGGILREGPPPDFNKVDEVVHQFKGSSASFGAHAMAQCCVQLREACHAHDQGTCQALLAQLQANFVVLKGRLEELLALEELRKSGG